MDHHVVLENHLFFSAIFLCYNSDSIESVVQPCARDRTSILVSELTVSMLDIVDVLAFELDSIRSRL